MSLPFDFLTSVRAEVGKVKGSGLRREQLAMNDVKKKITLLGDELRIHNHTLKRKEDS